MGDGERGLYFAANGDPRIRWRSFSWATRSPRRYLAHSLIWTGLPGGPDHLRAWRAHRLYWLRRLGWRLYRNGWA